MSKPRRGGRKRSTALNKKVLCFIDEYGTAGQGDLSLGAVLVLARDAGRLDKAFSDCLEPNASEIHAAALEDDYLKGLLQRTWAAAPQSRVVLLNQTCLPGPGTAPMVYAQAVVQTVKAGLKLFKNDVLKRDTIGNVELILDINHHNEDPQFDAWLADAQKNDGRFRGVRRVSKIDSAAARLLQLADVVAYGRKWINATEENAKGLRDQFGVRVG